VNELFELFGLQSWKPIVTALLLPPVPLLLLALLGARLMFWRRGLAWLVLLLACAGIWLSNCGNVGDWLERTLVTPPPALTPERIGDLRRDGAAGKGAIVVLGGGREAFAPEYGVSNLNPLSLSRLHYGLWLARQANLPVMFSGGVGHGDSPGTSEAEIAQRMAERDYGRPLKWVEKESRDTRENAVRSVALLKQAGVTEVVLVTHGWHMRRALRAFEAEARRADLAARVVPAPMGLAGQSDRSVIGWLPSYQGATRVRLVLREQLGLWFGA
jgi:uncharacterized SAM-binding protein YcdF (DUF218 family)